MIHYHGTPITPNAQIERMAGMHFCVSHARPDQLAIALRIGQSVMFDNGAYSAWQRGEPMRVADYYDWLAPMLAPPHWAVVPDVIDGTIEQQRELVAGWPFRADLSAPVWHLALPVAQLLELCERWPRVCFGSSGAYRNVGTPQWCARMDEAFNALTRAFGTLPWVHGLRMLDHAAGPWPLASADSTNVAQNFKRDTGCAWCKAQALDAANPPPGAWIERPEQSQLWDFA